MATDTKGMIHGSFQSHNPWYAGAPRMSAALPLHERVIVANVARNNAYQVAEAAEMAGYLKKFVTSIYYKPASLLGRSMHALAVRAGDRSRQRLELRHSPLIPDDKVIGMPVGELVEEGAR